MKGKISMNELQQGYTFTQDDLRKIAANEKRDGMKAGRTAAITELLEKTGAESIDDVLSAYTEYQGIQEAVSTEADRANQRAERLEKRAKAAEGRYEKTVKEYALRYALKERNLPLDRMGDALALADTDALQVDSDGNVGADSLEVVVEALLEPRPWLMWRKGEA
jgi:hypothetical protein